jgi:hypothetical protein
MATLSEAQLSMLLEGIDWRRLETTRRSDQPARGGIVHQLPGLVPRSPALVAANGPELISPRSEQAVSFALVGSIHDR